MTNTLYLIFCCKDQNVHVMNYCKRIDWLKRPQTFNDIPLRVIPLSEDTNGFIGLHSWIFLDTSPEFSFDQLSRISASRKEGRKGNRRDQPSHMCGPESPLEDSSAW